MDEIHTLETALRVRELRPEVTLVVELANPAVARALGRVSGPGSVLDVATLAGPSFVEACLGRRAHDIELDGVEFDVVQFEVEPSDHAHDTFRGHFGHLAPVAIMPADGSPMAQCPGRDHALAAGDRVAVLGTADELRPRRHRRHRRLRSEDRPGGQPLPPGPAAGRHRARGGQQGARPSWPGRSWCCWWWRRRLLHATYRPPGQTQHLSVLMSLYFCVETVATVGYGDYTFAHQPRMDVACGIVLIVAGVALVSTAFALFTNILVSRRIERSLGRRQVPGMTTTSS